jgi:hypothetical protein
MARRESLGLRFGFGYSTKGFHQFSPVFTSLWAAVEVNAVQTKYDIRRGAIAALKIKNTSHEPKAQTAHPRYDR